MRQLSKKQPKMFINPQDNRVWRVIALFPETDAVVWRADNYRKSTLPSFGCGYSNSTDFLVCETESEARRLALQ